VSKPLLSVKNLSVGFETDRGLIQVTQGVEFDLHAGQSLGIVGESGCGKSITSLALLGLLPQPAGKILKGSIAFNGEDLVTCKQQRLYQIRGNRIAMIFQEPMSALNPLHSIGKQIGEVMIQHRPEFDKKQRKEEVIDLLSKVGIPAPRQRYSEFPHQLSGGMRQRVMIAMALACKPDILIADEPTTALDVTIQAQILLLMKQLQQDYGMAIIFITHDLGVISEFCDDVVVMYAGQVVEKSSAENLFSQPLHPYSQGLLNAIPGLDQPNKSHLNTIEGQVPSIDEYPEGCRFANRCKHTTIDCEQPFEAKITEQGQLIACIKWQEINA
jgi:peptide/nickel transport system ATP-binding protein